MFCYPSQSVRVHQRLVLAICLVFSAGLVATEANPTFGAIDLRAAQIVVPAGRSRQEDKAVELLVDEIAIRTRLRLPVVQSWPVDPDTPVIAVGRAVALEEFARAWATELTADSPQLKPEGFRIRTKTATGRAPAILVIGNDARGVLYGVGKLLRTLEMSRDHVELPAPLDVTSAPAMPIRGHQIGYRPKTNSYDAWDLPQWEQYIRDLAVFGCNSLELIPPRSDDDADSPHFPLPPIEMMIGVSQLASDYGLDVWIWYPAMDASYSTPKVTDAAVREWGEVLSKLPRVDALFVPSGDPGHAPAQELMAMLAQQSEQLKRLHPRAGIWVSMQSFTQPEFEQMLEILRTGPEWLAGIVHGPQVRVSVAKLRELVPGRYPIRGYPDITHSMRCEYPVTDWDLAYALTEAREVINPRPVDHTTIFQRYRNQVRGVITYSEGCNDDVNKAIWSRLCWDHDARPMDTLREYSRYFIGPQHTEEFTQGLVSLEQNWRGPLLSNDGVMSTLKQFQALEKAAAPRTRRNWRFQQALYRAYYDAYQHCRLVDETTYEADAMDRLENAEQIAATKAIDEAEAILDRASTSPMATVLKARVSELAEALFQSIGMQLSVEKYGAIEVGRGANLDELDVPLNNRVWLKNQFAELRKLDDDAEILRGIHEILHWTDPGPGGFYDDLGDPMKQPHLVRAGAYADDPSFLETPTIGFRSNIAWRRSWCTHVDGLYETPVTLRYEELDPASRYTLRVVYAGDNFDVRVRLVAVVPAQNGAAPREIEVHSFQPKPLPVRPVEFEIPVEATATGDLTLTWRSNAERGGAGRGCQIAEVWLLKVPQ
jgi:hypothetical protein